LRRCLSDDDDSLTKLFVSRCRWGMSVAGSKSGGARGPSAKATRGRRREKGGRGEHRAKTVLALPTSERLCVLIKQKEEKKEAVALFGRERKGERLVGARKAVDRSKRKAPRTTRAKKMKKKKELGERGDHGRDLSKRRGEIHREEDQRVKTRTGVNGGGGGERNGPKDQEMLEFCRAGWRGRGKVKTENSGQK